MKRCFLFLKEIFQEWQKDDCPRLGAALSYYTVLSLAPLTLLVIALAGFIFGPQAAKGEIMGQINGLLGNQNAVIIQEIIRAAQKPVTGAVASIVGVVTLLVGASGVIVELREALNRIWRVKNEQKGLRPFIQTKIFSMTVVLGSGFLLLVSLVVSASLSAVGRFVGNLLPFSESILQILNFILSWVVLTGCFALLYKVLPDTKIKWHEIWIGAMATSLLFSIGKFAIGLYLGKSGIASSYGAAGSFVVLLLWVYYSAQIFYFGAEIIKICGDHEREAGKQI